MPFYVFKCAKCDAIQEEFRSVAECSSRPECFVCHELMHRDFHAEKAHVAPEGYSKKIVSHSLAMNPDQIPEHKKAHPNIAVTPDGCPVFDNYSDHNRYLEDVGYVKSPAKKKNSTTLTLNGES